MTVVLGRRLLDCVQARLAFPAFSTSRPPLCWRPSTCWCRLEARGSPEPPVPNPQLCDRAGRSVKSHLSAVPSTLETSYTNSTRCHTTPVTSFKREGFLGGQGGREDNCAWGAFIGTWWRKVFFGEQLMNMFDFCLHWERNSRRDRWDLVYFSKTSMKLIWEQMEVLDFFLRMAQISF